MTGSARSAGRKKTSLKRHKAITIAGLMLCCFRDPIEKADSGQAWCQGLPCQVLRGHPEAVLHPVFVRSGSDYTALLCTITPALHKPERYVPFSKIPVRGER